VILLNIELEDDHIIAADSVVKGKYENNSVIAVVPARRIATVEEYYEKMQIILRF
jgi:serine acetyltransferase